MLENLDVNIYIYVIYAENLAAQSLSLHQLGPWFPARELLLPRIWQILEFSCVPSPTPLSPTLCSRGSRTRRQPQPRSPGVSLKAQAGFSYHLIRASASSATGAGTKGAGRAHIICFRRKYETIKRISIKECITKCQQFYVSVKSVEDLVSPITCPFLGGKTEITSGYEEDILGLNTFASIQQHKNYEFGIRV